MTIKNISMALNVVRSFTDLVKEAREAETNDDPEMAIKLYQKAIKMEPHNELPYNRLMILYRKQKQYKEELDLINKGIKAFEEFYQKRSEKLMGRHKRAAQLSNALAKSLGQKGKKLQASYLPEPIPTWGKRKELVEKKVRNR
jgi:tetratricopeptide (TPR) repeat protein